MTVALGNLYRLPTLGGVYRSPDLIGESFVQPLKRYHSFFLKEIGQNSTAKDVARTVGIVAISVFAYPLFGALAALGMVIKFIDAFRIRAYNEKARSKIESFFSRLNQYSVSSSVEKWCSNAVDEREIELREKTIELKDIGVLRENALEEIDSFIRERFGKIYYKITYLACNEDSPVVSYDISHTNEDTDIVEGKAESIQLRKQKVILNLGRVVKTSSSYANPMAYPQLTNGSSLAKVGI